MKYAKTVVLVGDGGGDKTWPEPVGAALEMVPLTNPGQVKSGQEFAVRLLRDGQPVPQASIAHIPEGGKDRVFQLTDADGTATHNNRPAPMFGSFPRERMPAPYA